MITNRKEDAMRNIKIQNLRVQLGYTQEEIAKAIGITKGAYSLKENGHRRFNQNELLIIYKQFKLRKKNLNMQDFF